MHVADELKNFSEASERLLSIISIKRQLTEEEAKLIEHYCRELLAKIAPRLTKPR